MKWKDLSLKERKQIYDLNIGLVLLNTLKDKGKYQVQLIQFNQKLILLQLVILKMPLTSLKI
jgi:hypothetical protein